MCTSLIYFSRLFSSSRPIKPILSGVFSFPILPYVGLAFFIAGLSFLGSSSFRSINLIHSFYFFLFGLSCYICSFPLLFVNFPLCTVFYRSSSIFLILLPLLNNSKPVWFIFFPYLACFRFLIFPLLLVEFLSSVSCFSLSYFLGLLPFPQ